MLAHSFNLFKLFTCYPVETREAVFRFDQGKDAVKFKSRLSYVLMLAALLVVGCNIFNPGGEGEAGEASLNQQGEEYFRRGQYAKAMQAFERAIARDSANSMAYYGYAKSAVQFFQLDKIGILNDMQATAEDPSTFAFLRHEDSLLTLRLQAAAKVRHVLGILTDRDTLTQWYNYLTDSSANVPGSGNYDSLYVQRRDFISQYLVHGSFPDSTAYRHPSLFPLTDFRMPFQSVIIDYTAIELLYTITRLYDLNRDGVIDSADALMKKLRFGSNGGFQIDSLSNIAEDLEKDLAAAEDLNTLISSVGSGLFSTAQLTALMGGGKKDSTSAGGTEEQTASNMDSVITSLGDAVMFYQFGDGIDNDGDGCIDEEIMDDKDNDFDGFIDEDSRTIPATKSDGIDNDLNGRKDPPFPEQPSPYPAGNDSLEAPIGDIIYPGRGHVLGFVYTYLDTTYTSNGTRKERDLAAPDIQSTWVKIKKGAPDEFMKIRLDIQKDSLLTRRLPSGRLPDSLATKLQRARTEVGGCWRNLKTVSE